MSNPLTSPIAELFMVNFEIILELGIIPDHWIRYVDDVFAIVKKAGFAKIELIKFTVKRENNKKLAFYGS